MTKSQLETHLKVTSDISRNKAIEILELKKQLEKVTLELAREREINNVLLDARKSQQSYPDSM